MSPERTAVDPIHVHDLTVAYRERRVREDVDLTIPRGEFAALVGPNGSGKSTLLRILLGLSRPDRGEVRLLGEAPASLRDRWRVGYVPQRLQLAPDLPATVLEVVRAGRTALRGWWRWPNAADRDAVDEVVEDAVDVGLAEESVG